MPIIALHYLISSSLYETVYINKNYFVKVGVLITFMLLISACSSVKVIEEQQELLPRVVANTELSCPQSNISRCSIDSPLKDLADELFSSTSNNLHSATILDVGEKSLIARIHLIRAARESIEVQTYIWANDEIGGLFAQELIAAAKRGVRVRIIGDQLYSGNDPANLAAVALLHENFQVKLYNPLQHKATLSTMDAVKSLFTDFSKLNHRMHNKVMVFDGRIGITGGRNIENAYYNWDEEYDFLDRDVLIVGSAAGDMQKSFNRYWDDPITVELDQLSDVREHLFDNNKQKTLPDLIFPDSKDFDEVILNATNNTYITKQFIETAHSVSDVLFLADRPQKPFIKDAEADLNTSKKLRQVIEDAKQSVLMQTPYFLISNSAYKLFSDLRENNPDIDFTVSTNSLASIDQYIIYALSFKRKKRNVKDLQFKIHELKPNPDDIEKMMPRYTKLAKHSNPDERRSEFDPEGDTEFDRYDTVAIDSVDGPRIGIHSKSLVIDNEISVIGSHNFDPRGVGLNTEVTLTIRDKAFAEELSKSIHQYIAPQNSWTIAKRQHVPILGFITETLETISRMLPVFDIWPFRYTSSFELRDGMQPVTMDDPNFYEHYESVGQFPGTSLSDEQLKTILVSGFGVVAEPLM
ncbi:MAG TPA: phospholipase D family protein [Thiotrichaceae bacterium]|jgi:phosphatidylserine/phosphatidylglycerophosphate/cardiolipin synthase-like enzyme|nr:phospholipase D family protein [Thiotrichaceae bacterium]HIM08205.1 phospholipase D family protein [Gammaproteobacteria bacterium]